MGRLNSLVKKKDIQNPYIVDYAPSRDATCRGCKSKIDIEGMRLCWKHEATGRDGIDVELYHFHCGMKVHIKNIPSLRHLVGVGKLRWNELLHIMTYFPNDLKFFRTIENHPTSKYLRWRSNLVYSIFDIIKCAPLESLKRTLHHNGLWRPSDLSVEQTSLISNKLLRKLTSIDVQYNISDSIAFGLLPPCPICKCTTLSQEGYEIRCRGLSKTGAPDGCFFKFQYWPLLHDAKKRQYNRSMAKYLVRTKVLLIPPDVRLQPQFLALKLDDNIPAYILAKTLEERKQSCGVAQKYLLSCDSEPEDDTELKQFCEECDLGSTVPCCKGMSVSSLSNLTDEQLGDGTTISQLIISLGGKWIGPEVKADTNLCLLTYEEAEKTKNTSLFHQLAEKGIPFVTKDYFLSLMINPNKVNMTSQSNDGLVISENNKKFLPKGADAVDIDCEEGDITQVDDYSVDEIQEQTANDFLSSLEGNIKWNTLTVSKQIFKVRPASIGEAELIKIFNQNPTKEEILGKIKGNIGVFANDTFWDELTVNYSMNNIYQALNGYYRKLIFSEKDAPLVYQKYSLPEDSTLEVGSAPWKLKLPKEELVIQKDLNNASEQEREKEIIRLIHMCCSPQKLYLYKKKDISHWEISDSLEDYSKIYAFSSSKNLESEWLLYREPADFELDLSFRIKKIETVLMALTTRKVKFTFNTGLFNVPLARKLVNLCTEYDDPIFNDIADAVQEGVSAIQFLADIPPEEQMENFSEAKNLSSIAEYKLQEALSRKECVMNYHELLIAEENAEHITQSKETHIPKENRQRISSDHPALTSALVDICNQTKMAPSKIALDRGYGVALRCRKYMFPFRAYRETLPKNCGDKYPTIKMLLLNELRLEKRKVLEKLVLQYPDEDSAIMMIDGRALDKVPFGRIYVDEKNSVYNARLYQNLSGEMTVYYILQLLYVHTYAKSSDNATKQAKNPGKRAAGLLSAIASGLGQYAGEESSNSKDINYIGNKRLPKGFRGYSKEFQINSNNNSSIDTKNHQKSFTFTRNHLQYYQKLSLNFRSLTRNKGILNQLTFAMDTNHLSEFMPPEEVDEIASRSAIGDFPYNVNQELGQPIKTTFYLFRAWTLEENNSEDAHNFKIDEVGNCPEQGIDRFISEFERLTAQPFEDRFIFEPVKGYYSVEHLRGQNSNLTSLLQGQQLNLSPRN